MRFNEKQAKKAKTRARPQLRSPSPLAGEGLGVRGESRRTESLATVPLPHRRSFAFSPAFTLVEVMIVVVIIGLLAGVVTYATTGYLERAKRQKARADVSTLAGAVDSFYLANGRFPDNNEGLRVLVPGFIKVLPKDPWGNVYAHDR